MLIEIVIVVLLLTLAFVLANLLGFALSVVHLFVTEKDLTKKAIWFSILLATGLIGALGYFLTRGWIAWRRRRDPEDVRSFEDLVIDLLSKKDGKTRTDRP